ncbi:MAG: hypothetical protein KIT43_06480 [Bauldia sp.]|nr:hypothetical protein [Bauldia sp.]MCW5717267.1 hypothetical protein [Bauldia sp.]
MTAEDIEKLKQKLRFDERAADYVRRRLANEKKNLAASDLEALVRQEINRQVIGVLATRSA